MAWRNIEKATYESLMGELREEVNFARAARAAQVSIPTARRAYYKGWDKYPWARPIQRVLEEEKTLARAALQREIEAARKAHEDVAGQARRQAIESYAEEGKMVRVARNFMGRMAVPIDKALGYAPELVDIIRNGLMTGQIDADKAMRHLALIERLVTSWNEGLHNVMQMERLHLGKPEQIIGLTTDAPLTREDAERKIDAARTALDRMRARGLSIVSAPTNGSANGHTNGKGPNGATH
jgi:hypothetical protein